MENNQKYNVETLELKAPGKKESRRTKRSFFSKIKLSKRKRNIFKLYGFYLTLLLMVVNAVGCVIIWCTDYYDTFIFQRLNLVENSSFYKLWLNPKIDIIVRVYPFNYTNINAVLAGEEIPKVQELGPYVFRENSVKANVRFNGTELVTYTYNRSITFIHESSQGSLSDTIITPNVVYIAASDKVSKDKFQQAGLNVIMSLFNSKPFIKVSSYEFIMGYDDNFSIMLRRINKLLGKEVHPPFGVLSKRMGLSTDYLTIGTGVSDLDSYAIIKKFNDMEELDIWNSSECNSLVATDGFLFPRTVTAHSDNVYVYAKDLCRRIPLKFQKEFTNEDGFPVRRFALAHDVYASPKINPLNSCFCKESCFPSGIQDISPCFYDAPFILSNPHFMYADDEVFEKIGGMKPDPAKHTYFLDLHKYLGIPLKSHTRIQLGIAVNKGNTLTRYKQLKNGTYLPLCWLDWELGELPPNISSLLFHFTFTAPLAKTIMQCGFPLIFSLSLIKFILYMTEFFHK